ncbi:MAG: restriction endonuclease [Nitrospira sp.]|nr:restriction endonuclease [Nitrospira sp.]
MATFDVEPPRMSGQFPTPPAAPNAAPTFPDPPKWEDFEPSKTELKGLGKLAYYLSGTSKAIKTRAEADYKQAVCDWEEGAQKRESALKGYQTRMANYQSALEQHNQKKDSITEELSLARSSFESARKKFESDKAADLAALNELREGCRNADVEAIERVVQLVCLWIPTTLSLPAVPEIRFDPNSSVLLVDLQVPNVEDAAVYVPLKTKSRPVNRKEVEKLQQFLTYSVSLRIIHEVFATDLLHQIGLVCVNSRLNYINKSTGQRVEDTIASIAVERDEFSKIDVSNVDPKSCFRSLKGLTTPSYSELSAVKPIMTFDRNDSRIVAGKAVLEEINERANLASMNWEDFEHLVRELFSRMFSERSAAAEVNVTRASRDYGVDAIVFDPDPIHGGKFVIQAKRYVNRVDVSAVRDLYGTVQNEGANKGYLVTTSSFGPDAHAFAKDKPLTLIDGQNLLHLFSEYGYIFRIDLNEARQELNLRPKTT